MWRIKGRHPDEDTAQVSLFHIPGRGPNLEIFLSQQLQLLLLTAEGWTPVPGLFGSQSRPLFAFNWQTSFPKGISGGCGGKVGRNATPHQGHGRSAISEPRPQASRSGRERRTPQQVRGSRGAELDWEATRRAPPRVREKRGHGGRRRDTR